MYVRQIFGGSTPPKYLTDVYPSNIWGVYTSKIFDGCGSFKYLGVPHPPTYLTDVCPSTIWWVYSPKIFDGCMSVKYLGGLHLQNISWMYVRQIFGGSTPPKDLTDADPSNIWGGLPPKYI